MEASRYVRIEPPDCRRKLPATVDYRRITPRRSQKKLTRLLLTEFVAEGLEPCQVALLSFRSPESAFFAGWNQIAGKKVHLLNGEPEPTSRNSFLASSISAFKGLEADVVIVGDVPAPPLDPWEEAAFYVALTRTLTTAYVLAPQALIENRLVLE